MLGPLLLCASTLLLVGCNSNLPGGAQSEAREPTDLADLQVQSPEAIAYRPAAPSDVSLSADSPICFAQFVSDPLRRALRLEVDVGFGGSIAGAFDRALIEADIPRSLNGTSRLLGIRNSSAEVQRQDYQRTCAWTPKNIYVDLAIGMSAAGEPYRIELTIRQADKRWRQVVERSADTLPPGSTVWPAGEEGGFMSLAEQFAATLNYDTMQMGREVEKLLEVSK